MGEVVNSRSLQKIKTQEKNSDTKRSFTSTIMRGVFNILRGILAAIFKKLIYALSLILLFIRKPVQIFFNFFAGGIALFLFFLFFGDTAGAAPYEHQTSWSIRCHCLTF